MFNICPSMNLWRWTPLQVWFFWYSSSHLAWTTYLFYSYSTVILQTYSLHILYIFLSRIAGPDLRAKQLEAMGGTASADRKDGSGRRLWSTTENDSNILEWWTKINKGRGWSDLTWLEFGSSHTKTRGLVLCRTGGETESRGSGGMGIVHWAPVPSL